MRSSSARVGVCGGSGWDSVGDCGPRVAVVLPSPRSAPSLPLNVVSAGADAEDGAGEASIDALGLALAYDCRPLRGAGASFLRGEAGEAEAPANGAALRSVAIVGQQLGMRL